MAAPLIAVTADRSLRESAFGPRDSTLQVVEYADAVVSAGGRPAMLPATEVIPTDLLDGFDGLMLTGGGDLSPELYGQEPDEKVYGVSPIRDRFEAALVAEAQQRGLPILAICRGMQLINVLRGGSLLQHIDAHWQTRTSHEVEHDVAIDPSSRLAEIVGASVMGVNSYHHQAVDSIGSGLRVTARAGDVVEAFEDPDANLIAVQWHPEHLFRVSADNHALFDDLVGRARAHKERNTAHV
ncbi:gamma-glutamyl-gamma-aminobutyrate hydrolase family protein [Microbacterium thalassium]|uniref:Putative glutamine amidotransferase n=1 Tax=Microbacterium thalassium TaxID=362649 RepID=A0A7X0KTC5_9MICO|nr:gamma-glutamyl-gamma-aminobutyrate hydrolase family protein [Microbacterium thalassium]MBB6389959.1 putative glutamine amidotransferase [Microbacterium thalassium]GLK24645.1 gamma-glutamyl-gamma-aminobutyrate hydrolase [Microbacterium thalassium]